MFITIILGDPRAVSRGGRKWTGYNLAERQKIDLFRFFWSYELLFPFQKSLSAFLLLNWDDIFPPKIRRGISLKKIKKTPVFSVTIKNICWGPVHTNSDKFENATFFIRLYLPSPRWNDVFEHQQRNFLKTLTWQQSCAHVHACSTMHLCSSGAEAALQCGRRTFYPFSGGGEHYRLSVDREYFIRFQIYLD